MLSQNDLKLWTDMDLDLWGFLRQKITQQDGTQIYLSNFTTKIYIQIRKDLETYGAIKSLYALSIGQGSNMAAFHHSLEEILRDQGYMEGYI